MGHVTTKTLGIGVKVGFVNPKLYVFPKGWTLLQFECPKDCARS